MQRIEARRIAHLGWSNCIRLSNGVVDLIVTTDVGPRVIHYGFTDERNEFCVWDEQAGLTGGDEWRCYGGSRLWHGPEIGDRCYEPDNEPVEFRQEEDGFVFRQRTEKESRIEKETRITFLGDSRVGLDYRITNHSPWPADVCIWVLTLMEKGGRCIVPAPRRAEGLAPNSVLPHGAVAFWPYTSLADPRFRIGERYLELAHDPSDSRNFKIGLPVFEGWAAYLRDGILFLKEFEHRDGERYPDFCSSFELYCCERYAEVETLSPMKVLRQGEGIQHRETWSLHRGVDMPRTEDEIDRSIRPRALRKATEV